jgi:hypothetical protein
MSKKARSPRQSAPEQTTAIASKSQLEAKRAEIARSQPSVGELASLAAAFVAGHKARSPEAVRQALALWKMCKDALRADVEQAVKAALAAEEARTEAAKIPMPKKFPVPLNRFLQLIASNKTVPDRYQKFRSYLADTFDPAKWKEERLDPLGLNANDLTPPDAKDWANDFIGALKQSKVSETQYKELAPGFIEWLKQDATNQARGKAKTAAAIRWANKKKASQAIS